MEHYSTKLIDFKVYVVIVSKLYTTLLTVNIPNFYYVNSCYKWFLPPPPPLFFSISVLIHQLPIMRPIAHLANEHC